MAHNSNSSAIGQNMACHSQFLSETHASVNLQGGIKLTLTLDDILNQKVDAIVNPANSYLAHNGGLACAIKMRAGNKFVLESQRWVQEYGPVEAGTCAITTTGEIKGVKYIIHTVGPIWDTRKQDHSEERQVLRKCISEVLRNAENYCLQSVAIPPISSGIFGYPKDLCAIDILTAIDEYAQNASNDDDSKVSIIIISIIDRETFDHFMVIFKQRYPPNQPLYSPRKQQLASLLIPQEAGANSNSQSQGQISVQSSRSQMEQPVKKILVQPNEIRSHTHQAQLANISNTTNYRSDNCVPVNVDRARQQVAQFAYNHHVEDQLRQPSFTRASLQQLQRKNSHASGPLPFNPNHNEFDQGGMLRQQLVNNQPFKMDVGKISTTHQQSVIEGEHQVPQKERCLMYMLKFLCSWCIRPVAEEKENEVNLSRGGDIELGGH